MNQARQRHGEHWMIGLYICGELSSYKFRFLRRSGISLSVSIVFRLQVGRSGLHHPAGARDFAIL